MKTAIYHCLEKIEIKDKRMQCRIDPVDFFYLHSHDFWEIPIQLNGNPQHTLNGESFSLLPQTCILISAADLHQIHPCNTSYTALNLVISDTFMKACCDYFSPNLYESFLKSKPKVLYLSNGQFAVIKDFTTKLQSLSNNSEREPLQKMLLSYMLELFYNDNFINTNSFPKIIKDFIYFATLPENIDLKASKIPEITNYSYSYFSAIFKETTGQTINSFLTNIKMNYAYTQITKSNIPLLELSSLLGYQSLSHFITIFKKHYGVSPSRLRPTKTQKHNKNNED